MNDRSRKGSWHESHRHHRPRRPGSTGRHRTARSGPCRGRDPHPDPGVRSQPRRDLHAERRPPTWCRSAPRCPGPTLPHSPRSTRPRGPGCTRTSACSPGRRCWSGAPLVVAAGRPADTLERDSSQSHHRVTTTAVVHPDGDPCVARGGANRVYQGDLVGPTHVAARGSPDRLSHPWKCERSPAAQASRSPGVLRSQSGRISLVAARRSRQRS